MPDDEKTRISELGKTNDEEKLVKLVRDCVGEARENQDDWARRALKNIKYYSGQQWLDAEGEVDRSSPVWRFRTQLNIIFSNIQTICSAGLDARPRIYYSADQEGQSDVADSLTDLMEAFHEERMEEWHVFQTLLWLTLTGIGWRKYGYSSSKNMPIGSLVPSWDILVDPHGTMPDLSDHKYVAHVKEMDIDDVVNQYKVDEEDIIGGPGVKQEKQGFLKSFLRTNVNKESRGSRKRVEVWELWFFGHAVEEMISGKTPKSVKYPRGRVITICGEKLLHKGESPYNHGRYPFVPYHGCTAPSGFLGFGVAEQILPIQFAINVLISQYIMGTILMSNPQWIAEKGAIEEQFLTNEPGLVIKTEPNKASAVQRVEGVAPAANVLPLVNELLMFSERVSTVSEVMMGRQPSSNTSGIAIAGLQQASMLLVRQLMRWFEVSYKLAGIIEAENIQQFAIPMNPSELGIGSNVEGVSMSLGEWFGWQEEIRDLYFDVHIQSLSELPRNLEGRLAFALQLMEAGIFDIEEFLDFTRLPVSERLRQVHSGMAGAQGQGAMGQRERLAALQGLPGLGQGVTTEAQVT